MGLCALFARLDCEVMTVQPSWRAGKNSPVNKSRLKLSIRFTKRETEWYLREFVIVRVVVIMIIVTDGGAGLNGKTLTPIKL